MIDRMEDLLPNVRWGEIAEALGETLAMVSIALVFTVALALPLGILMYLTGKGQLRANPIVYGVVAFIVNIIRSVPFIILMIAVLPFTALLVGTTLGVAGALPPMIIAATPFLARLVEIALREVDHGLLELGQSMAASTRQIVSHILLPEARPALLAAVTVTAIALIDYTAMSGVLGGGGLGDLAIRYGYQRFQTDVMVLTIALQIILVQLIQFLGDRAVHRFSRSRRG
ncbi:Methionine import system permease protein MetP [Leucobacter soli]|uniref:Methionine import system permease protein MetP n=3 Tax=Leucobacter soli TaxID=2812850 RepID=A0A916JSU8_9MICO|nr:methionine ABC transporter permease [Leucobacter soli]CAG7598211.1 Methionine import system permease protein MetP [Leucobacter soli]